MQVFSLPNMKSDETFGMYGDSLSPRTWPFNTFRDEAVYYICSILT